MMDLLPTRDLRHESQTRPRALVVLTLQGFHYRGDRAEIAEQAAETPQGRPSVSWLQRLLRVKLQGGLNSLKN